MEQEKLKELFESIKKDDLKSFSFIMTSNTDLNISFGRFPMQKRLESFFNIITFSSHTAISLTSS